MSVGRRRFILAHGCLSFTTCRPAVNLPFPLLFPLPFPSRSRPRYLCQSFPIYGRAIQLENKSYSVFTTRPRLRPLQFGRSQYEVVAGLRTTVACTRVPDSLDFRRLAATQAQRPIPTDTRTVLFLQEIFQLLSTSYSGQPLGTWWIWSPLPRLSNGEPQLLVVGI